MVLRERDSREFEVTSYGWREMPARFGLKI